jgi:MFS transporter, DHA1 family, inner membrane transport protein
MQIAGGAAATVIGGRLPPRNTIIVVAVLNMAVLAVLWAGPGPTLFSLCIGVFGFLWLFVMPYQASYLLKLDATRNAATQLGTAQLLGSGMGPLVASLFVIEGQVHMAIAAGIGLLICAIAAVSIARQPT